MRNFQFALALPVLFSSGLFAANFSFQGSFSVDDQQQQVLFNLSGVTTVTLYTQGYAGGTNTLGNTIVRGGFDPILSLFQGTGPAAVIINNSNDGGCPPVGQDSVTSACWDSYIQTTLPAGSYTLVLTQSDNGASGPTLGDGFSRDGQGNFTGPAFLGVPGSFIDANPNQRNGNWSVDLLNVNSASLAGVPEPGTLGVAGLALCVIGFSRRKKS